MKGIRASRGRVAAAICVGLALALGGCALLWMSPSSDAAPVAKPQRSAGAEAFEKWCADCHATPDGPGSLALQRRYQGELPAVLAQRSNLSPDYVRFVVRQGMSFMPSFRKTEISDADLALLTAYLASAQPSDQATASKASESPRK